jgi:hypothetical protein
MAIFLRLCQTSVEHLHRKTGILNIYGWSTHGRRHLALERLQSLHLLGRGRRYPLERGWWHLLELGGWGRRHLLGLGGWGRRHLLGLGGRGRRHLLSPRFLDGSLDAMRLLEEGEALGFTSW